jgi:hypothetical protein
MWNSGEFGFSSDKLTLRPSDGYFKVPTIEAGRFYVGNGNDGYFFSDTNGRTAFKGGDFYIQDIANAYNYAARNHHGASSGCEQLFRGNRLTGNNWSIQTNGEIFGVDCISTSDRRLKENFLKITDPIGKLKGISGWTFNWIGRPDVCAAHTIAQDVRKVYPEAVREDEQGKLSVSLTAEIALLIEVCKVQQSSIEKLKETANAMQKQIDKLENK